MDRTGSDQSITVKFERKELAALIEFLQWEHFTYDDKGRMLSAVFDKLVDELVADPVRREADEKKARAEAYMSEHHWSRD